MFYSLPLDGKGAQKTMQNAHSSALTARHAELDARLADERRRPAPNNAIMAVLKKQKLRIKEMLARL